MPKGEYLQYGGQAVIEGVMMRSPRYFSVAVRAPNGEIVRQTEALEKSWLGRQKWLKLPFLRGGFALIDALSLGIRAMHFSSNVQIDPKYQADAPHSETAAASAGYTSEGSEIMEPQKAGGESLKKIAVGATMVAGLGFGVLLFVFLPQFLGELFKNAGVRNPTWLNVISGLLKFVIFIGYIWLISRMKEIKRVFQYHGAEHKAINALEAEQELSMENCLAQTRLHPRCGTSFAIVVLIIDFIVLIPVDRYLVDGLPDLVNIVLRFLLNLALLPVIAGVAYELIRFAGKFRSSKPVMALFAPGLATQYLTTAEPDESQIEVALAALNACLVAEQRGLRDEDSPAPQADETAEPIA